MFGAERAIKIHVGRGGLSVCTGDNAGAMAVVRAALAAVAREHGDTPVGDARCMLAELLAIELRALEYPVEVVVDARAVLVHRGCGLAYAPGAHAALLAIRVPCPALGTAAMGWYESRTCGCGSTVGLAAFDLVVPAHVGQA